MFNGISSEEEVRKADLEKIQELFDRMCNGWNRHDMKLFSSIFSEDASFVNVAGMFWKGKNEIEAKHTKAHESQMRQSVLEVDNVSIRFVRREVAIIQMESSVRGDRNPDGTPRTQTRHTIMTAVALKEEQKNNEDQWRLVAAHNTNKL